MELTYRDLVESDQLNNGALSRLLQISPAPSARLAAKIARNVRLARRELQDFVAARKRIDDEHKAKLDQIDENATPEQVKAAAEKEKATLETMAAEIDELLNVKIDVDIHPITIAELEAEEAKNKFPVSPDILVHAYWIFDLEEK